MRKSRLDRVDRDFDLMTRAFERLVRNDSKRDRLLREMSDQIAANTQAVLSVLDRLGPAPG